ncbi:alpha amylase [Phlyctema vagabunda]|uniref:Alpha-amylase n=1 Tax=Phlyctema vagabunda TaxID=108571 RepID=A0ABR4P3J3_9HELO
MQSRSGILLAGFNLLIFCLTFDLVHAATRDEWRSRSIYQLVTDRFARTDGSTDYPCNTTARLHCGGTYQGIINQLDYIQGMGFTAVWISPVVKNIEEMTEYGEAYHGYWPADINEVNPLFGTPDDLKSLSNELHKRNMFLMVDVVVNHMAIAGPGEKANFSGLSPFNKAEYYHPYCVITDYLHNKTIYQNCWMGDDIVALADLDTENEFVISTWQTWITNLVADYSIDGLRIDAAKHVDQEFWPKFQSAAGVFTLGEILDPEAPSACEWSFGGGLDSILNYPSYYNITQIFQNSSTNLGAFEDKFKAVAVDCYDSSIIGTFTENHDTPRFAAITDDLSRQMSALTYSFLSDGIPIVYYGAEQRFNGAADPDNREALWLAEGGYNTEAPLYKLVKKLNKIHTVMSDLTESKNHFDWSPYWAYRSKTVFVKEDVLVFRKGHGASILGALTNIGVGDIDVGPYNVTDSNFVTGNTIVEILGCQSQKVGHGGSFNITLVNGEPQIWVPEKLIDPSEFCEGSIKKINQ